MSPHEVRRRLLVVDDDPNSRFIAQRHLLNAGYEVFIAEDMKSALKVIEREGSENFGAVVTDYCMPGGSGLDLLRETRSLDATLSFVIATAVGERELVTEALREGASGFLDKPVNPEMLRAAVTKAVEKTAEQRGLQQTATAARALGESQLALLGMHTAALNDRIQIVYLPHSQASGDFVTAFSLAGNRMAILASDVSGHDLKAAYKSIYFHGLARGMIERGSPIDQVFGRFNELLLKDWNKAGLVETSIATLGVHIDAHSGTLTTLNCGFPWPMVSDEHGWLLTHEQVCASPLGWFEDVPGQSSIPFSAGLLSFWSDGLEALAERLDVDPLSLSHRLLSEEAENDSLTAFAEDDIVVVRARARAATDGDPTLPIPVLHQRYAGSEVGRIDSMQEFWDRSLRVALPGISEDNLFDVILCIREALLNGLEHGCSGRADIHATLQVNYCASGNAMKVRVTDGGKGHDFDYELYEQAAAEQLLAEHRGFVLIKNLSRRLDIADRGTRVTMEFAV